MLLNVEGTTQGLSQLVLHYVTSYHHSHDEVGSLSLNYTSSLDLICEYREIYGFLSALLAWLMDNFCLGDSCIEGL